MCVDKAKQCAKNGEVPQMAALAKHGDLRQVTPTPQWPPNEANLAAQALEKFKNAIKKASDSNHGVGGGSQIQVFFEKPVKSRLDVALRLESLMGDGQPKIPVQFLVEDGGQVWRKPAASQWWAESGGDKWKVVFRVNCPSRSSYRKASRVSVQYHVEQKELTIMGVKQNLSDFSVQWVLAFGPIVKAFTKSDASVGSTDIQQIVARSAVQRGVA